MNATPTTAAVIRAYNEGEHIGRLLHGLSQQTVPVDELIVVDSGSQDDTTAIAERYGATVVRIDKSEFSFGRSLNRGCEAAKADVLLILSAHVYPVYDTFVEKMLGPFVDSSTGIAYGRQVGDHRTKFSESRIMLQWFPEESIWDQGHPFSNNANSAVRRETWGKLRYDEDLTGLEDLEFAARAIDAGERVAYVAEAPVVHVHEEPWSIVRNRYRREAIAYKKIMDRKPMPALEAIRLAVTNTMSDYVHAGRKRALLPNFFSIPAFRAAQFIGAWEGFKDPEDPGTTLLKRFYYPPELSKNAASADAGKKIEYTE